MSRALGPFAVHPVGYGAMQLERVEPERAHAVLRRAVEAGVDHLDTASFYGDAVVNRLVHDALHPYADGLVLVSKVGAEHVPGGQPALRLAQRPEQLRAQVELDLRTLGVEQLHVVNLRRGDRPPGLVATPDQVVDLDDQLAELVALRAEGKIGAVGLSNVDADQLRRALPVGVACVQDFHNVRDRGTEPVLDLCREHGVAWVPFFPLGSGMPGLTSVTDDPVVRRVAGESGHTPGQVALAWLLGHYDDTLLIPGTASLEHLEENLAVADVVLSAEATAALDALGAPGAG